MDCCMTIEITHVTFPVILCDKEPSINDMSTTGHPVPECIILGAGS